MKATKAAIERGVDEKFAALYAAGFTRQQARKHADSHADGAVHDARQMMMRLSTSGKCLSRHHVMLYGTAPAIVIRAFMYSGHDVPTRQNNASFKCARTSCLQQHVSCRHLSGDDMPGIARYIERLACASTCRWYVASNVSRVWPASAGMRRALSYAWRWRRAITYSY